MEKSSNIDMFITGSLDETNYTWQRSTEDRKVQKLKAWEKKRNHRDREEKFVYFNSISNASSSSSTQATTVSG